MVLLAGDDEDHQNIRAIRDAAVRGAATARGPADAEDAAHDALVEMMASDVTYENPTAVARRAGRFRGIDHGRRAARQRAAERAQLAVVDCVVAPPDDIVLARLHVKALLELAQSELSRAEFDGLVSLYREGGTISEAARVLASATGQSVESVRTQIRRAVQKAREIGGDQ